MIIARRNFLIGMSSAIAAPAIVRIQNIMPVKIIDYNVVTLDDYYRVILHPMLKNLERYRYLYDGVE